ncbi:MAG: ABC transporter permease [Ekhidna sp.]
MNLPFFIARKYFLSGKKKNFINVISIISMIVVAIGTMCLIIALSFFNGLEGLLRSMYGNFDPDVIIKPATGKSFAFDADMYAELEKTDGVLGVTEVIEDHVLVRYKEAQRVARMKGVSRAFDKYSGIKQAVVAGDFALVRDSIGYALLGRGVQYDLSLSLKNDFYSMQLYYAKDIDPGVVNPQKMFNILPIVPGGVFAIEKYYDENFVFVPIEFAEDLLGYQGRRSSFELYLEDGMNHESMKEQLQLQLGDAFLVQTGDELHSSLYKVLKIEKLFIFGILAAIIGIASVNIFFCLTMLVIEKKKDISVLIAQGASSSLVRRIFLFEGYIIAFTGAIIGLFLGLALSFLQQEFGFIGMGMDSAVVSSYPIKVEWLDVLLTVLAIVIITVLASVKPAIKAAKSFSVGSL